MGEVELTERKIKPEGRFEPWQKVFIEMHADAASIYAPGTRYECRLVGKPPFRTIALVADQAMNQIEPWTDTPEQTADHYRVGRYTTPKE